MKKLLLLLLLPIWAQAQIYDAGTLQRNRSDSTVRGNFGSRGLMMIPTVSTLGTNGQILVFNSATNKYVPTAYTPVPVGLSDSLAKKANRTFDNVASGAIAKAKVDTTVTGIQTVSNFFPKGDTRWLKTSTASSTYLPLAGGTMTGNIAMNNVGDQWFQSVAVTTAGRKGLKLSNGSNIDMKISTGGNQTLGAFTESDNLMVYGTGYQGGGGGNEKHLWHSTGKGNMFSIDAQNSLVKSYFQFEGTTGNFGTSLTSPIGTFSSIVGAGPFTLNHRVASLGFSGIGGLWIDLTSITGQPYVTYTFNNGNVVIPSLSSAGTMMVTADNTGKLGVQAIPSGGGGGVSSVSINSANGFTGSSTGGANPALTIATTFNDPVLAAVGGQLVAATKTGTGSTVVMSASPTLSGTVTAPTFSGDLTGLASNSTLWNGNNISGSIASAIQYALVFDNVSGGYRLANASGLQGFLGLGSNAYNSTAYAPLASPALTGNPTAPTQTAGDNSTKIATTAYVDAAVGGATSGTYTPTLTNGTNVASSSATLAHYSRVGNEVTVTGQVSITVTYSAMNTVLGISLPIASNFASATDLRGVATPIGYVGVAGISTFADDTNDRQEINLTITASNPTIINYSIMYTIIP